MFLVFAALVMMNYVRPGWPLWRAVTALFWEAGYSYVQLLELAEEWNVGEFEAKARAARAIQSGDTSIIDEVLGEGPASTFMTAEEIEAADMKAYEEEFGLSADS